MALWRHAAVFFNLTEYRLPVTVYPYMLDNRSTAGYIKYYIEK